MLVLAGSVLVLGCSSDASPTVRPKPRPTAGPAATFPGYAVPIVTAAQAPAYVSEQLSLITDDAGSSVQLENVIAAGAVVVPTLVDLSGSTDPKKSWAGVAGLGRLVHSTTGGDQQRAMQALVGHLSDADATLRAYAAGGLAGTGSVDGLAALIDLLDSDDELRFSEPPELIRAWAYRALRALTIVGPVFEPYGDETVRAREVAEWQDWLASSRARLQFDSAAGTYVVR